MNRYTVEAPSRGRLVASSEQVAAADWRSANGQSGWTVKKPSDSAPGSVAPCRLGRPVLVLLRYVRANLKEETWG
jgi:hypothetical protein